MSFFEGTVRLKPGLTVIVGPNGSGKSAIFHAIKFGLGSNQRENRYGKWSDFIRWGASSAEIEITVKVGKEQRVFKRRIDSDGVPRAYVDGKRVRAAEFRRIVESLGFDVDNPLVFMPQERVTALKDASPIEVRKLIEEGTGLDALRDRLLLQESGLKEDRQRLDQAIAESLAVETEIRLLSGDLKRLEKKKEYLRQQQILTAELKWATLLDLDQQIERIKKKIDSQQEGVTDLHEEKAEVSRKRDALEEQIAKLDKERRGIERNIGTLEGDIKSVRNQLENMQKDSAKTLEEIERIDRMISKDKKRLRRLRDDLKRAVTTHEHAEEVLRQKEQALEEVTKEIDDLTEQLSRFEKWSKKYTRAKGKVSEIDAWIREKQILQRSLQTKIQSLEARLESINNQWGEVWSTLENTSIEQLERDRTHLDARLAQLTEEKVTIKSRLAELQKESSDLDLKLSEANKRIPESIHELKKSIEEHGLTAVVGPIGDMLYGQEELATAIEAVLSNNLIHAFIATDRADFQLAQKLRDTLDAPAPIILVDPQQRLRDTQQLPQNTRIRGWLWDLVGLDDPHRQLLQSTFGKYAVTTDVRTAIKLAEDGINAVTLKGQVFETRAAALVGHPRIEGPKILSAAPIVKRRRDVERKIQRISKQIDKLDVEIVAVTEERDRILGLISRMSSWESSWQERTRILQELPEVEDKKAALEAELEGLISEREAAKKELDELVLSQPAEREKIVAKKRALEIRRRTIENELSDARADIKIAEQTMKSSREQMAAVSEDLEMMEARRAELKSSIDRSEDETIELLEQIKDLEQHKKELEIQERTTAEQIEQLRLTQRELIKRITEIEMRLRSSTNEVNKLRAILNALELKMQDALIQVEGIERPERVRDHEVVHQELIRIKDKLSEYDDVNESVEIRNKQLQDRLTELNARVDELRDELQEAEVTVNAIKGQYNEEMTKTLRDLEAHINKVLRQTGFRGEVRLALEDDPATGGVNFQTRIKGGTFKSIKVGSGGERTILIIALIIALHQFNPAPIYALDEVDIFLDSKNTDAIGRLFRTASEDSQLIVFTPGKSTHMLKHADRILGVVTPQGDHPSVLIESPRFKDDAEQVAN